MLAHICPDILSDLWQFDTDLFKFISGLPRWIIPDAYKNREKIVDAFEEYTKDPRNKDGAVPMIISREEQMRKAEMGDRDIGAHTFALWFG
jgi:hypothetical protein